MTTLAEALPMELDRCRKLLAVYEKLGPVGAFGHAAILAEVRAAERAMAACDVVGMVRALAALRGCE